MVVFRSSLLAVLVIEASLDFTRDLLVKLPGFQVPSHYPDLFRVDTEFTIPMEKFLGMSLSGNVFPLVFFGIWLFTNIFCEEVLWRGYALPRMEKVFGKWAWVINGILWNVAIHFFFRWSFIVLIPISMVVPYLCQRYKSMIPGVIIHGGGNLLIYALLIPSYFS
ncbi:MAG: CPBP family intramembrane metalloprotease, partial [Natronospirillum sp.]